MQEPMDSSNMKQYHYSVVIRYIDIYYNAVNQITLLIGLAGAMGNKEFYDKETALRFAKRALIPEPTN